MSIRKRKFFVKRGQGIVVGSFNGTKTAETNMEPGLKAALLDQLSAVKKVKDFQVVLSAVEKAIKVIPDNIYLREYHLATLIGKLHDFEAGWIALGRFTRNAIERNSEDWLLAAMRQLFGSPYDYSCLPFAERFSMGKELSDRILTLCPQWDARSRALSYAAIAPYYHENGKSERAVELIEEALELVEGESLADDVKQEWLAQLLQALEKYKA
ncbi:MULTISPECIES: hypothetical protein [Rhizobium]|uniref:Tetratricopeptide repeat protein n=1 Tax=Rhizobium brockwellii TaxID=3019932 RepID=A0ABU3YX72_9HYPH|nr:MULTISPECIES: hypothetical protein [Rhizobium]MDV4159174.1 hypothetical protein [Rhizobium brockwellii]MDV4183442.1 hypothetical protein [Rhizobium brockwellii]MDV4190453.1 hypothetical protein [Rhizobium brockwellii]NZD54399.1 hypothetical protein [Rhizobium leguminosarum]RWX23989.1 hypothetical protein EHH54_37535 [Rhizobium leguminosarum]